MISSWKGHGTGPGDGARPDYRFSLANERTYLAWIRTSAALIAGGTAIWAIAGDDGPWVTWVVCMMLTALGGILAVLALSRWIRIERAMRRDAELPAPGAAVLVSTGVALGAFAVLVALASR